ncbi:MAG: VOC family protein [Rhodospirillaceae bacterium]|nr:VOC family protein [Rhodospirillaceae bacterium]
MLKQDATGAAMDAPAPSLTGALHLAGVHHTARPTWKLRETVAFYRDVMGLKLIHAIAARGWGPAGHPDFLHFFFDSGQGSTIAFFYYLRQAKPAGLEPYDSWLWRSTHTSWRVETAAELDAWFRRFEEKGVPVRRVAHEVIDSVYVNDPNGYMVEITWQRRPFGAVDAADATLSIEAAIELENEAFARGDGVSDMEAIWRRKSSLVARHIGGAEA